MDKQLEKTIQGLELCTIDLPLDNNIHQEDFCQNCPYHNSNTTFCFAKVDLMRDALQLIKAQNEVIQALLNVGYPHGFYLEEPWVVSYMYAITDVIKKAVNLNNERFAGKDDSGTGRSENNLLDYTRR